MHAHSLLYQSYLILRSGVGRLFRDKRNRIASNHMAAGNVQCSTLDSSSWSTNAPTKTSAHRNSKGLALREHCSMLFAQRHASSTAGALPVSATRRLYFARRSPIFFGAWPPRIFALRAKHIFDRMAAAFHPLRADMLPIAVIHCTVSDCTSTNCAALCVFANRHLPLSRSSDSTAFASVTILACVWMA